MMVHRNSDSLTKNFIINQIALAFPIDPVPDANSIVEDTYLVEDFYEFLVGRPWSEPTVQQYRWCYEGFWLLTVKGLHYYLPGYLTADLTDRDTADIIAEYFTYMLSDDSTFGIERMTQLGAMLTINQINAVTLWFANHENQYGTRRTCMRRSRETIARWVNSKGA